MPAIMLTNFLTGPQVEFRELKIQTLWRIFALVTAVICLIVLPAYGKSPSNGMNARLSEDEGTRGILVAKRTKLSSHASSLITVSNIRFHAHDEYTRVVLDLPANRKVARADDSNRQVTLYLKNARLGKTARKRLTQKHFPRGIKITQQSNETLSIRLNPKILQKYELQTLRRPDRIVIDLYYSPTHHQAPPASDRAHAATGNPSDKTVSQRADMAMATTPEPPESSPPLENSSQKEASPPNNTKPRPTVIAPPAINKSYKDLLVVIDPGHGGKDPGAIGAKGTREKEVTLNIATTLQDLIENRLGTKVLLTRTNDVFLDLEDRVAFANSKKADVFVSIHVNSHPEKSIRGLEVYHFGKASDPRALEVAARENGMTLEENAPAWQFIIADKLNDQKIEESQTFAWTTRETLLNTLKRQYTVKDHGVKTAPFYVLRFTTMPSILTEVAFVSNPSDEKWLRSRSYQKSLAEGMYKGIQAYLKTLYPGIS